MSHFETSRCRNLRHGVLSVFIAMFMVYVWLLLPWNVILGCMEINPRAAIFCTTLITLQREVPVSFAIVDMEG